MAKVVFEDVTKVFGNEITAVNKFNLEVEDKEFVVLVGPSGCGKSTTLRMVAGLEEITDGKISIDERLVNDVPPKDRDIAMVFQNYALYPHMTVYKNMAFGLKLRKYPKDEIERRVNIAAEILSITPLLNRKPKALSGGQRQRVAVGRAIVRQPKVFLFDEPLSNLDAKLRVQMRAEISKLHNRLQATMIYVTHDQLEAMTMGDRIVVMKDGLIQQVDTPISLYDNPVNKFVAGFIGTPPMNFIDGKMVRSNGKTYFDEGSFKIAIPDNMAAKVQPDQPVVFGIRPEHMRDRDTLTDVDEDSVVSSRVEVIEPVGAEALWYFTTGQNTFIARVDSHCHAEVNRDKSMVIDVEKAHLFDPSSEETII